MLSLHTERDVEALRQAALLLESENARLHRRISELQVQLASLTGADAHQLQVELLEELEALQAKRPTRDEPSSAEASSEVLEEPKAKQKGHGPRDQPKLFEQLVRHELAESKRQCDVCGGELVPMGSVTESTQLISVVRRQFVMQTHECEKYRCACNAKVVTAPGPERLQKGGRYSVEFGVEVAVSKYLDHMPLERQVRAMAREGLVIDSQTLFDQLVALCRLLELSYDAIGQQVLSEPVVHVDETRWPLLARKGLSPHSVFGLVGGRAAYYRIPSSKSLKAARKILGEYRGTAVADGYQVYETLSRAGPFELAHCWAHVKRKFSELEEQHPAACSRMLGLIRDLYEVERELDASSAEEAVWLRARHLKSRPIVEEIRAFCFDHGGLPRSGLGKATRYVLKYWDGLTLFLDNPKVPLDNNAVERALRGPVVGRKNHYGSKSKRGTKVAAILYTLCETAKLCGVDPWRYLAIAAKRAVNEPGLITLPQPGGGIHSY